MIPIGFLVANDLLVGEELPPAAGLHDRQLGLHPPGRLLPLPYLTTLALSLGLPVLASLIALPMAYLMAFVASPATAGSSSP